MPTVEIGSTVLFSDSEERSLSLHSLMREIVNILDEDGTETRNVFF
jgi:hypothetical protein